MKKEIVLSTIIILLVIIGNIITQNYTKQCVEAININLVELKEKIDLKNKEDLQAKVKDIENDWDEMQKKLAYYIEHDELEKVEIQISTLKGNIEGDLYEESFPEVEKCIFILEHIQDKTVLNVKNIF